MLLIFIVYILHLNLYFAIGNLFVVIFLVVILLALLFLLLVNARTFAY